jgi:polyhydroxybutyrate depolymerase
MGASGKETMMYRPIWRIGRNIQEIWIFFSGWLFVFFFLLSLPTGHVLRQAMAQNGLQVNPKPGDYKRSLPFGGRERSYVLHVPPAYTGQKPLPLVIVLHGRGGNAQNAMRMSGMSEKADKNGFIVAYPDGTGFLQTWNAGNCCGSALDQNVDDVGFIRVLIEDLQKEFFLDKGRIYATGMSNGARMAYRLGCEFSDKLAAIAPVAGALNFENCQPARPLSVVIFHGTADKRIPYEGAKRSKWVDRHQRIDISVSDAASFWVKHNQCSNTLQKQERGNIIRETYSNCKDGTEVVLYTIKGGGHAWPGGKKGMFWRDEPTQEISATELMWDFFMRHPKG